MAARKKPAVNLEELLKPKIGEVINLVGVVKTVDEDDEYSYVKIQFVEYGELSEESDEESFWISKALYEKTKEDSVPELRKEKIRKQIEKTTAELVELKAKLASI